MLSILRHGFYEDAANEFAPFGSDEGFDVISLAEQRRDEITQQTTVDQLLKIVDAPLSEEWSEALEDEGSVDDAVFITAAAFALLRLTGQIDHEGRRKALQGLTILVEMFGEEPELLQQRSDLETWTG